MSYDDDNEWIRLRIRRTVRWSAKSAQIGAIQHESGKIYNPKQDDGLRQALVQAK